MTSTKLSAKQAAEKVGKATSTITAAIKSGKISAHKNENGGYEIEPAELFRVYPNRKEQDPKTQPNKNGIETNVLQVEVKFLSEQVADLKEQLTEAKEALNNERLKTDNLMLEYKTALKPRTPEEIADLKNQLSEIKDTLANERNKTVQPFSSLLGVVVGAVLVLIAVGAALAFSGGLTL